MENQKIIKRNGQIADFDIAKISKTVERALQGFALDENELLNTIPSFYKENMPTSEKYLIYIKTLSSIDKKKTLSPMTI